MALSARSRTLAAGLLFVLGCHPEPVTSAAPSPADPGTCARLADHLVVLLAAELEASGLAPAAAEAQREPLLRECLARADAEAAACLLAAHDMREAERCPSRASAPGSA